MQLTKKGIKFLIGAVAMAVLFLASVVVFAVSAVLSNGASDLGFDVTDRSVVKMTVDAEGNRIAGTQNGGIFAFSDGGLLWDVGALRDCAVRDILSDGGRVYVAYADGSVVSFREEDALAFCAPQESAAPSAAEPLSEELPVEETEAAPAETTDESAPLAEPVSEAPAEAPAESISEIVPIAEEQKFEDFTLTRLDYTISGGVSETQLLAANGGVYLRARCNDGKDRNYLFRIEGEKVSRVRNPSSFLLGGMTLFNGKFYYSMGTRLFTEKGEELLKFDESILALSSGEEGISMVTESGRLVVYDAENKETVYDGGLGLDIAPIENSGSFYIFSTGENFLAKIRDGGVAYIETVRRGVTLSMAAGNNANFILWNDDCFMLRDTTDVTHPVITFYTVEHARSAAMFAILEWVFLALALLFLAAAVILFLCISEKLREKLKKGTLSTLKAIWRDRAIYLALLIPFLLLITFYYVPIVLGFSISFMDYVPGQKAVFEGFKYFSMVVRSSDFWSSAGTMLLFLLADLAKALIPPFIIAELLILCKLKRFSLWIRILLFLPGILPGVAATLVWQQGIFDSSTNSLVNAFIKLFAPTFTGLNWIYNPSYAVRVLTIICFGFPWVGSYLIFFGALGGINTSIFEAAKLDGCPWITRLFAIDIPLIVSQIKYVLITTFIASVQNYGTLYILYGTGSGDTLRTPALMMYSEIMAGNYNVAGVMGVFLFLFLAVVTVINFRSQKEQIE